MLHLACIQHFISIILIFILIMMTLSMLVSAKPPKSKPTLAKRMAELTLLVMVREAIPYQWFFNIVQISV